MSNDRLFKMHQKLECYQGKSWTSENKILTFILYCISNIFNKWYKYTISGHVYHIIYQSILICYMKWSSVSFYSKSTI